VVPLISAAIERRKLADGSEIMALLDLLLLMISILLMDKTSITSGAMDNIKILITIAFALITM
jgi:hypothetical protein